MHGTYRGVEVALDHGDAGQQVALQDEGELEEALDASVEDLLIRPLHQAGHTLPSILLLTWVFLMNLRQAMHSSIATSLYTFRVTNLCSLELKLDVENMLEAIVLTDPFCMISVSETSL